MLKYETHEKDLSYMKYYYGATRKGTHKLYGPRYGLEHRQELNCSDKAICIDWFGNNSYKPSKLDVFMSVNDLLAKLPARFPQALKKRSHMRNIIVQSDFHMVYVKTDVITKNIYNFTVNCLAHGKEVAWEVGKDTHFFRTDYDLVEFDDCEQIYASDYPRWKGVFMPYPTVNVRKFSDDEEQNEQRIKDLEQRITPEMLEFAKDKVEALGLSMDGIDLRYYLYETSSSFEYFLRSKVTKDMLHEGKVRPHYASLIALYFKQKIRHYYNPDENLLANRREKRRQRTDIVKELNPDLFNYKHVSRNFLTWTERETSDNMAWLPNFMFLDKLQKAEQFYGPTALNKDLAQQGKASLWKPSNQHGFQIGWDYRDYAHSSEESGFDYDAGSFSRAYDSMCAKQPQDWEDLYKYEQYKLFKVDWFDKLDKEDLELFLHDGYKLCKCCGEIYKLERAEFEDIACSEVKEYTMYTEDLSSIRDDIMGELDDAYEDVESDEDKDDMVGPEETDKDIDYEEEDTESDEVVYHEDTTNILEETFCPVCREEITIDKVLKVSPEYSTVVHELLEQGVDEQVIIEKLVETSF